MRMTTLILFALALYAAGATGYIMADSQQEPEIITEPVIQNKYVTDEPNLFDTQNITGLQEALAFNDIDKRAYRVSVYDCREFAAALENHLKNFGFDCGRASLIYGDTGHRITWVRINETVYFVEPQTDEIYTEEEIKDRYPETIRMTLHDFNTEVKRDEVFYYEN
jgi:hypothetical protein